MSTTYGASSRQILLDAFDEYRDRHCQILSKYEKLPEVPTDLKETGPVIRDLERMKRDLEGVRHGAFTTDLTPQITNHYKELSKKEDARRDEINRNYSNKVAARKSSHEEAVRRASEYNASLDVEMRRAHKELIEYKPRMERVFKQYEITPLDTAISDDTTEKEFTDMLQCSVALCEKYTQRDQDIIQKGIDYVNNDDEFTVGYVLGATAVILVLAYFMLPVLSVAFFVRMFMSRRHINSDVDGLRLACSLMAEVDYQRFIPESKYERVEDMSTDDIAKERDEMLEGLKDYTDDYARDMELINNSMEEVNDMLVDFQIEFDAKRHKLLKAVDDLLSKVTEKRDDMLKTVVRFPSGQNLSSVMTFDYTLHTMDDVFDVTTNVGMNNFVFDSSNYEAGLRTMKIYLMNMLANVKPGSLTVEIADRKSQCREFSEFFRDELQKVIKPSTEELNKKIEALRTEAQKSILEFKGKNIIQINDILEKDERMTKNYTLLIIMDPVQTLITKDTDGVKVLEEFLAYSASLGMFIWIFDSVQRKNTVFVKPLTFKEDAKPIEYTLELGNKMMDAYTEAYTKETKKLPMLPYFGKYTDKVCPDSKIWTFDTIKGIELNFGYLDGDPSRPANVMIGDDNVHAILVGGTGSGKSATINQIISTLTMKYPPSELIINFIDLKNAEASKFAYRKSTGPGDVTIPECITDDMEYMSRIPHTQILSGTSDGGYALSIISELLDEMKRRQIICAENGVVKVEDLRKQRPDIVIPRILTIIDEFQQMFNKELIAPRVSDSIATKLIQYVKLARAFGGHLLFASQSMTGTLGSDALANFSLRCALRCDANVSSSVLGNVASSKLPPKGYMYSNDTAGADAAANKLWRVPFIPTDDLLNNLEKLNGMLESRGEERRRCMLYSEAKLYPVEDLYAIYENFPELKEHPKLFVLGEYASYSSSKIPYNFELMSNEAEDVIIAAFDQIDALNLTYTMLVNTKIKNQKVLINVQDADAFNELEVENFVEERLLDIARPSQSVSEFLDAVEDIVDTRYESEDRSNMETIFVFGVYWDRADELSNTRVDEKLVRLLKKAPVVNVHFILTCGRKGTLSRVAVKTVLHKICGKQEDAEDTFYLEESLTGKLPSRNSIETLGNFAIHKFSSDNVKFKVYQKKLRNKDNSRTLKIT